MKTCTVYGDMQADSAADQYPTVPLCDGCVAEDNKAGPDHQIVSQQGYDPAYGDACEWCGTTAEEEAQVTGDCPGAHVHNLKIC